MGCSSTSSVGSQRRNSRPLFFSLLPLVSVPSRGGRERGSLSFGCAQRKTRGLRRTAASAVSQAARMKGQSRLHHTENVRIYQWLLCQANSSETHGAGCKGNLLKKKRSLVEQNPLCASTRRGSVRTTIGVRGAKLPAGLASCSSPAVIATAGRVSARSHSRRTGRRWSSNTTTTFLFPSSRLFRAASSTAVV